MDLWKDIPNFEGLYQANINGEIRSLYTNKILKPEKSKNGYMKVMLCKNKKRKLFSVHRLIIETFIGKVDDMDVNHKDCNKQNNKLSNLEYCTRSDNIKHSFDNKLQIAKKGQEHPLYKKYGKENKTSRKVEQYDLNNNFIKLWDSIMDVERELGINNGNVSSCCNGKKMSAGGFKWKHHTIPEE